MVQSMYIINMYRRYVFEILLYWNGDIFAITPIVGVDGASLSSKNVTRVKHFSRVLRYLIVILLYIVIIIKIMLRSLK